MAQMERCPACRAKLAGADICARCGTDFSLSGRAERQALALTGVAVRELAQGHHSQAAAAADAATALASSPLAQALSKMLEQRQMNQADVLTSAPEPAASDVAGQMPQRRRLLPAKRRQRPPAGRQRPIRLRKLLTPALHPHKASKDAAGKQ